MTTQFFQKAYTNNYYYDNNGNRVPIKQKICQETLQKVNMMLCHQFSFLTKVNLVNILHFHKNMTPQALQERKIRLKDSKKEKTRTKASKNKTKI